MRPKEQVLRAKSEPRKEHLLLRAWESIQSLHSLFWDWQFPFQSPVFDKRCPTATPDIQIVILWLRLLLINDYVELKQVNSISHRSLVTNFRIDLEPWAHKKVVFETTSWAVHANISVVRYNEWVRWSFISCMTLVDHIEQLWILDFRHIFLYALHHRYASYRPIYSLVSVRTYSLVL
jgi:hypothetical protein